MKYYTKTAFVSQLILDAIVDNHLFVFSLRIAENLKQLNLYKNLKNTCLTFFGTVAHCKLSRMHLSMSSDILLHCNLFLQTFWNMQSHFENRNYLCICIHTDHKVDNTSSRIYSTNNILYWNTPTTAQYHMMNKIHHSIPSLELA